jgi:serpin B
MEAKLTEEQLNELLSLSTKQRVRLMLPKFEMNYSVELSTVLSEMGMPLAFDDGDFSGMTKQTDIGISNVFHKTFIKVDEQGTEAAAATGVVMTTRSMPMPPIDFKADHPFVYLIRHQVTNETLFMGRVVSVE